MARAPAPPAQAGLAAVLLVLGFLVSTAFVQQRIRDRELPRRAEALRALVASRQQEIDRLAGQAGRLTTELGKVEEAAGRGSAELGELLHRVEVLEDASGLGALRGQGVTVTLTDSSRAPATRADTADLTIQDVDLQLVVNELWRAGAEAVSINGRRVVATTAIRSAGGSILVNYGAVTSPYRIVALGDRAGLSRRLSGSEVGSRFQVWTQVYGLGFEVVAAEDLRVPALAAAPELRHARPEAG